MGDDRFTGGDGDSGYINCNGPGPRWLFTFRRQTHTTENGSCMALICLDRYTSILQRMGPAELLAPHIETADSFFSCHLLNYQPILEPTYHTTLLYGSRS